MNETISANTKRNRHLVLDYKFCSFLPIEHETSKRAGCTTSLNQCTMVGERCFPGAVNRNRTATGAAGW